MPRRHRQPPVGPRFAGPGGITKPCPWPRCVRRIPRSHVLCSDDWAKIPMHLKKAWNEARTDEDGAEMDRVLSAIQRYARREAARCS